MVEKEAKKKDPKSPKKRFGILHPNILPRTFGQTAADKLTKSAGSWTFILIFVAILILWMIFNTSWLILGYSWDAKPFILLNLVLSCLAALQAPLILMSQNRQSQKDRQRSEYDYSVNRKAEREIQDIKKQLTRIENRFLMKKK